ncbi:MAG: hypothetical protein ACTSUN_08155 [Promethearchaeota archaeon]
MFDKIRKERTERQNSLDKLLDKYVTINKRQYFIEKYAKISELIAQTEREVEKKVQKKIRELQTKFDIGDQELELVRQGSIDYNTFISKLRSAEPESEEQRKKDLADLESAISILESYDEELYKEIPERYDIGMGMFLDKMTRRFQKIMKEHELTQFSMIPIQRLKYHAFQEIKNIKDVDILSILKIMKNTNMIEDIIEINPTLTLILLKENETLELFPSEKVLISLAYDEPELTREILLKITEWKEEQANRVIENLKQKELIQVEESSNKIIIASFGTFEERKAWNDLIKIKLQDEKEKEEIRKRHQERMQKLIRQKIPQIFPKEHVKMQEEKVLEEIKGVSEDEEELSRKKLDEMRLKKKPKVKGLPIKPKEEKEE